jgi:serine protease AprX
MRSFIFCVIAAAMLLPAISTLAESPTSWAGPDILSMPKEGNTIASSLSDKLATLPADDPVPILVFFTDKGITVQSEYTSALATAENALTPAARSRRLKVRGQENLVDFYDLPVYAPYIEQIVSLGSKLREPLRWFNASSFAATSAEINQIASLPYVRLIREVRGGKVDLNLPTYPLAPFRLLTTLNYGQSAAQLNQINVIPAHELGFAGQGVIVCMMDVGYRQAHQAFQPAISEGRLLAQYDFINHDTNTDFDPSQDTPGQADHGTVTWSTLGGQAGGNLYGPAYKASFILAKTEDISSERHIEEDNWAAGAMWADSIGASVISSSLGYRVFDTGQGDYSYSQLDGNTAIVTQAADLAAHNGIAVCNAMGNNNDGNTFGSLVTPADADSIISVGAVDNSGSIASFSGWGPTFDGRIKPEVCALGIGTYCADPGNMNGYTQSSGTSLSTPLVGGSAALLFSAHPNWSNMMVREALMMTADRADSAGSVFGWGIMDVSRALYYHPAGDIVFTHNPIGVAPVNEPIQLNVNIIGGGSIVSADAYWRAGNTGNFTDIPLSTTNGSDFTGQISAQTGSLVQYYFKAINSDGLFAYNPLGDSAHPYSIGLGITQITDSFEDGLQNWISGGTFNSWGLTTKYARTGELSITDSPTENYRNNTDSWLQSAFRIDMSHVSSANFSFYWKGVLQSGHDSVFVEASTDDGTTWNRFPQSLNGSVFNFTQITVDMAPYIGLSDVRLRFHFKSDASTAREGVYIDDIAFAWVPTGIIDGLAPTPRLFSLDQNYPNPFNPSTAISFSLGEKESVNLYIFDLLGRKIRSLISTDMDAGSHSIVWDGRNDNGQDVASGMYLYRLQTGSSSETRRMTLVR